MRIPVVRGIIDRRILANFRVDPNAIAPTLPEPFRPKLVNGHAIGGICLIRLKAMRPRFLPLSFGIGSENAAHRIAVEWDSDGRTQQGVYIPRRDTNSRLNTWAGGTIFPGIYHHATFSVTESDNHYSVSMQSDDSEARVVVRGSLVDELPSSSVFSSVAEASDFFERGSLGYSFTRAKGRFDGMKLHCQQWQVRPLTVEHVESSFFQDPTRFPPGSVEFDCGLVMHDIRHEWHGREDLCCAVANQA